MENNQLNQARLDHLHLSVRNFEESIEWYRSIFNFHLVERGLVGDRAWGIVRSGDSMLCLNEDPTRQEMHEDDPREPEFHRMDHFALRLQNEAAFAEIVREKGLKTFYGSPVSYPHSSSWYVEDPTGHCIEVVFWKNDEVMFKTS